MITGAGRQDLALLLGARPALFRQVEDGYRFPVDYINSTSDSQHGAIKNQKSRLRAPYILQWYEEYTRFQREV